MNAFSLICLKLVRWTGWLLLPVVLGFFATGYAMTARFGLGAWLDEDEALTLHRLLHLPLGVLVVAHVVPSTCLALMRWGWIKSTSKN